MGGSGARSGDETPRRTPNRILAACRSAAKRPQLSNAGSDPSKSWQPGLAHRVGEVARGSAQLSPAARSRGARPTPRSGSLPGPRGPLRGESHAHAKSGEGVRVCVPRAFGPSGALARWRVCGRPTVQGAAGIGSVGDAVGAGGPRPAFAEKGLNLQRPRQQRHAARVVAVGLATPEEGVEAVVRLVCVSHRVIMGFASSNHAWMVVFAISTSLCYSPSPHPSSPSRPRTAGFFSSTSLST